ncbi:MAG: PAS domain S-box protein [Gammaproteobacteria bacterium]|nr:PAS domain S-box protein [Gammaproteobacteria bacterium]
MSKVPNSQPLYDPSSSAQLYLSKLAEFSKANLETSQAESSAIIDKAVDFIREVISFDYALVGSVVSNSDRCRVHATYGIDNVGKSLDGQAAMIMSVLTRGITTFGGAEAHAIEMAATMLKGATITAGISVPIYVDKQPLGLLAIYCKNEQTFSTSQIIFLEQMAGLISYYLQLNLLVPAVGHAAQKVVEAKIEWEKAIDSFPQLVIVLDAFERIVRVNRAIYDWGLGTVSSHKGSDVSQFISELTKREPGDVHNEWQEAWTQLKSQGLIEWESISPDSDITLRYSLRTLKTGDTELNVATQHNGYAVLIIEDITKLRHLEKEREEYTNKLEEQVKRRTSLLLSVNERLNKELEEHKRNKIALQISKARYTHLVQNTLAGICIIENGCIEFSNNRFLEILGYNPLEIGGKKFIGIVAPDYRKQVSAEIAKVIAKQSADYFGIVKLVDNHYTEHWIEIKLDLLEGEEQARVLVNIVDITKLKQIEETLRENEKHLHILSSQLISAQEAERKRLAAELHDGLGQELSSIKYKIESTVNGVQTTCYPQCKSMMHDTIEHIRMAIDETRRMAMDLRPTMLDDLGVIMTISWFCRRFQETYQSIKVHQVIQVQEQNIREVLKVVIYRVLQEALNNVAKHAQASEVYVSLYQDAQGLCLEIEDNGCGISTKLKHKSDRDMGFGLSSMRERVEQTGGSFNIIEVQPNGTRLEMNWNVAI